MKKLAYTTSEYFLDVDIPVIRELKKTYDLYWIVFMKVNEGVRFTVEEVQEFSEKHQVQTDIIRIHTRYRSPAQFINDFNCMRKLRRLKADIYYFQAFPDPYMPVLCRLFLNRRKTVIAIHDAVPHQKFRSALARINEYFYFNVFRNYHLFSENQKLYFEKRHPGKNILMARLSLKDFGPAVIRNGEKKNFLFFGVIQYNKGVDFLIEAANMLAEDYSGFTVTIAGKCDDFEPYRQKIKHPEVFNLIIKVVPNSEIPILFGSASFLVLPYRDVTQSGPLQIAFNYNIPVIASDFPGFREYITPGLTGLLFEPNNPKSLYEVMKMALNYSEDKIVQIKKNQAEFVMREISNGNISHRYVEFFEKL